MGEGENGGCSKGLGGPSEKADTGQVWKKVTLLPVNRLQEKWHGQHGEERLCYRLLGLRHLQTCRHWGVVVG